MNIELSDRFIKQARGNMLIKNFRKELTQYHETVLDPNKTENSLKQENTLYQVVDLGTEGVYLQNINNNYVSKETDLPKEILDKIENDTVLQYRNGRYHVKEELTQEFLDSLIGIKEFKQIQDQFIKESRILENNPNTRYKIEKRDQECCILSYGIDKKTLITVPNALIPFWAKTHEKLYYKNGKFHREV